MSPLMIAQLIIALGPSALQLIKDLAALWHKTELTKDEILAIVESTEKSYDEYLADAQKQLSIPGPTT